MCNCFQNYFKWYKIKDKTKSIRRNLTCKGANDQLFSLMNTHLSMTLLTFVTRSSGIFVKIRSCKVVTSSNPYSCFNLQQLLIPNSLRWGMVPSSTIHFSNFSSIHSFNIQSSGRPVIHFPLKELPKSLRIFKWRRCPRTSIGSCYSFDADRVRILRFGGNSCSWIALGNVPADTSQTALHVLSWSSTWELQVDQIHHLILTLGTEDWSNVKSTQLLPQLKLNWMSIPIYWR